MKNKTLSLIKARRPKQLLLILIVCSLALGSLGAFFGQRFPGMARVRSASLFPPVPTPTIPPPENPSKEYIYLGDRLLATEEPTVLAAPTQLTGYVWCAVHLNWIDNSADESGFVIERSMNGGSTFSVYSTLPANSTEAHGLPRPDWKEPAFIYRVRAVNAGGSSPASNSLTAQPLCHNCVCQEGTPDFPPNVAMVSPANGATVPSGYPLNLIAQVSDQAPVNLVQFFNGATLIGNGTLVSPPTTPPTYIFTWTNPTAGNYSISATATETTGTPGSSQPINLTVAAAPTVSITAPANNASFVPPGNITITANASAPSSSVTKVEFFQGGSNLIGTATSAPYTVSWNSVSTGSYTLTAKVTSALNATTTSSPISVIVDSPPSVSITSPTNGAAFTTPTSFSIDATASDSDGSVTKVEFYDGATKLGEDLSSPYSYQWNSVPAGNHTLTAKATDNLTGTTTSTAVNITVTRMNVALAANGGTAVASSTQGSFAASYANNGDRIGASNALWTDNTNKAWPDWLEIDFNGNKTINEIDVITRQDNTSNPVEPTSNMTFTLYGVTSFDVQYWNGTIWKTVTNGSVTGNSNVWRQFTFSSVTTNKIRVMVNAGAGNTYSRIVELEAWTAP
jgi:hypothetical protein